MAKLKAIKVIDENAESGFSENAVFEFKCPGCGGIHRIPVKQLDREHCFWGFNGNIDKPTFWPSLLMTSGHYVPDYNSAKCWCTYKKEHPEYKDCSCYRCHSFVKDGTIQFLSDCTHDLKGQTVELPEII